MPVSTPVALSILAIAKLEVNQRPPGTPPVRVMEPPTHTVDGPLIGPAAGFTVTTRVTEHAPTE